MNLFDPGHVSATSRFSARQSALPVALFMPRLPGNWRPCRNTPSKFSLPHDANAAGFRARSRMGGRHPTAAGYYRQGERTMHSHIGRVSRGNRLAKRRLLLEQNAANHELALKWREEWRVEKSAALLPPADIQAVPAPKSRGGQRRHRAKFAQAIARLEFGRGYWNERLQRGRRKTRDGLGDAGPAKRAYPWREE
jgi:hypothetical protein